MEEKLTIMQKMKKFYGESQRVLTVTRKPNREEYKTIVKVSGLGMAIIGIIGFILTMIKQMIFD